jgi:hypothetical protein
MPSVVCSAEDESCECAAWGTHRGCTQEGASASHQKKMPGDDARVCPLSTAHQLACGWECTCRTPSTQVQSAIGLLGTGAVSASLRVVCPLRPPSHPRARAPPLRRPPPRTPGCPRTRRRSCRRRTPPRARSGACGAAAAPARREPVRPVSEWSLPHPAGLVASPRVGRPGWTCGHDTRSQLRHLHSRGKGQAWRCVEVCFRLLSFQRWAKPTSC